MAGQVSRHSDMQLSVVRVTMFGIDLGKYAIPDDALGVSSARFSSNPKWLVHVCFSEPIKLLKTGTSAGPKSTTQLGLLMVRFEPVLCWFFAKTADLRPYGPGM